MQASQYCWLDHKRSPLGSVLFCFLNFLIYFYMAFLSAFPCTPDLRYHLPDFFLHNFLFSHDGKPEDVLNPKKKQLEKITPVC